MDIILEVADTFFFDRVWATLLPAQSSIVQNATATFSSLRADATALPLAKQWIFIPATKYFHFEPSQYAYQSQWPRDVIQRQFIEAYLITWVFGIVLYFLFASISYAFVFDKNTFNHPKFLKNQVWLEIKQAQSAMPLMSALTALCFTAEIRGHAKLYDSVNDAPFSAYNYLQFPLFIIFTDFFIYWIHRGLHHPRVYKTLHKPHHKWIMPTPFASHAFHPLDGFAQSFPYHVFPFIFPLQKFAYILLFVFINFWTIFIHDGEYYANSPIINGAACHGLHHEHFRVNYGQFTTIFDRMGGTYSEPPQEMFDAKQKNSAEMWAKQSKKVEEIQKVEEGDDDRVYSHSASKKLQ